MTQPQNHNKTIEDQLADFTDRILADKQVEQDEATLAPDPELRALEQTSLRLKHAFGNEPPEEAAIQRMQRNIIKQWKQEQAEASQSIWQKWFKYFKAPEQKWQSQSSRQRFSMAVSFAVIAVLLLVAIPLLNGPTSNQPGASGQNCNSIALIVVGGLILLAVWLFRRKP